LINKIYLYCDDGRKKPSERFRIEVVYLRPAPMKNLDFYIDRPETNQLLNKEHLDNLLLQGLASGESIKVTKQWWDEKRAALKKT
jgi:hypothetical protein